MQENAFSRNVAGYIENPDMLAEGQEPTHVPNVPFASGEAARDAVCPFTTLEERWEHSRYFASLNGEWQFRWRSRPDADAGGWESIRVPSSWQTQGYGRAVYRNIALDWTDLGGVEADIDPPAIPREYNPVGTYRRTFEVPDDWLAGRRTFVHFEGVKSAFFLWVNGEYVGYDQGSMTPAEFDLTDVVSPGENTITVRVFRFSDGTYLEAQDMLRMCGLHRDVYLYSAPEVHLRDFSVRTDLGDDYRNATVHVEGDLLDYTGESGGRDAPARRTVRARLLDPDGETVDASETRVVVDPEATVAFEHGIEGVRSWSAESPDLYTLLLEVRADDETTEVLHERVGVREVEVLDGQVCVNGEPIYVRGVNRHEHDPDLGRTVPPERIHEDLRRMKELNVNAIRTSHYPSDPSFYALAQEYGFYVVDEVNAETHYDQELVENHPEFHDSFLDRFERMVERDKNFACVVAWSTGNEAGTGPAHYDMAGYAREVDGTRLVMHQGPGEAPYADVMGVETGTAPFADVAGLRYPSPDELETVLAGEEDRPIVLGEYNHAPGNSLGITNVYWELINEHDQLQGGFVWEWLNHSLTRETIHEGERVTYQWSDDTVEPLDGIALSDRRLTPQTRELAHSQAPITVEAVEFTAGTTRLRVHNRHSFTDLSAFEAAWRLQEGGEVVESGTLNAGCAPLTAIEVEVPVGTADVSGGEAHLTIEFAGTEAPPWRDDPCVVVAEQFELPFEDSRPGPSPVSEDASLSVSESGERVRVACEDVTYLFDRHAGDLVSASVDGVDVLESGPRFDVWRPPTVNESTAFTPWCPDRISGWLELGLDDLSAIAIDVEIEVADPGRFELAVDSLVSGPGTDAGFEVSTRYRVHPDGVVACTVEAHPNEAFRETLEGWLPRIGVQFDVPRDLSSFEWYGRGPHESYPDRKESALLGRYAGSVDEQVFPYCPPQATGNKCDTRWAALTDDDGRGVLVFGGTPASVGLQPYENVYESMYAHELQERETIGLDLDWRTAGVGGTPVPPLAEHRVYPEATEYAFGFRPLGPGEDPMTVWRGLSGHL